MALSDFLDFFTGGGETETGQISSGTRETSSDKGVLRRDQGTSTVGKVDAGRTDVSRLGDTSLAGGETALQRILALQSGKALTRPGFNVGAAGVSGAEDLRDRALALPETIAGFTAPIVDEARRTLTDELGRGNTRRAAAAGSSLNSFVDVAAAEGQADLESQLASLEAKLQLEGLQLQSQDLLGAEGALLESGGLLRQIGIDEAAIESDVGGTVAQILQALTGARETGTTRSETEQVTNTQSLIDELTRAIQQERAEGSQSGFTDTPGSFSNFASGLSKFVNTDPNKQD